jgi:hypothetical protein
MGGFFLYVPILPALTVTVMLGGLCAMFWLGVRVGRRPLADTRVEEGQGNQLSVL